MTTLGKYLGVDDGYFESFLSTMIRTETPGFNGKFMFAQRCTRAVGAHTKAEIVDYIQHVLDGIQSLEKKPSFTFVKNKNFETLPRDDRSLMCIIWHVEYEPSAGENKRMMLIFLVGDKDFILTFGPNKK